MAVTVQQINPSKDGSTVEVNVEEGQYVDDKDGTLYILDAADGHRVAVFAAGTWLSAQLEN